MKEDKKITVAKRLREARIEAGFKTARAFIEKYQLSQSTYSLHETGQRSIGSAVAIKYCNYLNIDINWLLTGSTHPATNDTTPPTLNTTNSGMLTNEMLKEMTLVSKVKHVDTIRKRVDQPLLSLLIEELLKIYHIDCLNANEISEAISGIYSNIEHTTEDSAGRKLLVKPLINAYKIGIDRDTNEQDRLKVSNLD